MPARSCPTSTMAFSEAHRTWAPTRTANRCPPMVRGLQVRTTTTMGTTTRDDDDDDHRRAPQLVFYISNKGTSPGTALSPLASGSSQGSGSGGGPGPLHRTPRGGPTDG